MLYQLLGVRVRLLLRVPDDLGLLRTVMFERLKVTSVLI